MTPAGAAPVALRARARGCRAAPRGGRPHRMEIAQRAWRCARRVARVSSAARSSRTCSTIRPSRWPPRRCSAIQAPSLVWSKSGRLIGLFPGAHRAALRRDGHAHRLDPSLRAVRRAAGRSRRGGSRDHGVPRSCRGKRNAGAAAADRAPKARSRRRCRACCCAAAARWSATARMRARCSPRRRAQDYLDRALSPKKTKELRRQRRRLLEHGAGQARDRARCRPTIVACAVGLSQARSRGLEGPRRHRRAAARGDPGFHA